MSLVVEPGGRVGSPGGALQGVGEESVGVEALFTSALGLERPWVVEDVKLETARRRIDFAIACEANALACPACGACGKTTQLSVPWARPGSGFTAAFEALALALLRELPVRQAAEAARESHADRIGHHVVDCHALARTGLPPTNTPIGLSCGRMPPKTSRTEDDDKTAAFCTDRDAARHGTVNVILEGTMRDVHKAGETLRCLRGAGYDVDVSARAWPSRPAIGRAFNPVTKRGSG